MAKTDPIELQKALRGADYPTDREQLANVARSNGADKEIVNKISELKQRNFNGPDKVEQAVFQDE